MKRVFCRPSSSVVETPLFPCFKEGNHHVCLHLQQSETNRCTRTTTVPLWFWSSTRRLLTHQHLRPRVHFSLWRTKLSTILSAKVSVQHKEVQSGLIRSDQVSAHRWETNENLTTDSRMFSQRSWHSAGGHNQLVFQNKGTWSVFYFVSVWIRSERPDWSIRCF